MAAGCRVVVVDKGRGVGGRLATRRVGEAVLDHGAQFFTARDPAFVAEVTGWLAAGVAAPWYRGVLGAQGIVDDDGEERLRGVPGMTGVAKHLATGLDVRTGRRAVALEVDGAGWAVALDDAERLRADAVVLTPPAPQALALLAARAVPVDPVDRLALERIAFDPCLAVLAVLDRSPGLGPPGARRPGGEPVAWVADNQVKGVSPVPALTVHAGPVTSRELWRAPDREAAEVVLAGVELGGARVVEVEVQRWRYAQPTVRHAERCLVLTGLPPAVVAGDAFGPDARVEGAARSGVAAAAHLTARLGWG